MEDGLANLWIVSYDIHNSKLQSERQEDPRREMSILQRGRYKGH